MLLQRLIYGPLQKSMPMRTFLQSVAFHMEAVLLSGYGKETGTVDLIKRLRKERAMALTASEAYLVYTMARRQRALPGEMAEVGVYKGGTARLICEAKGSVPLHLFDTFAGLPAPGEVDAEFFQAGWYAGSLGQVQDDLAGYENVFYYLGHFPETVGPVADKVFSFVHLDVDLYQSMANGLAFFYPRLGQGGVILTHDYQLPGTRQAIDEFCSAEAIHLVEMPNSQCLVIKT